MADTVDLTSDDTEAHDPPRGVSSLARALQKPAASDEIDLTEDSPRGGPAFMDVKKKRVPVHAAAEDNEDFHKKRIMSFASSVSVKRQRVEAESIAPALAAVSLASNSPARGPARKVRRTQGLEAAAATEPIPARLKPSKPNDVATAEAIPVRPKPAAGGDAAPGTSSAEENAAINEIPPANLLLAQLHAERVARQKARGATEAGPSQPSENGADMSTPDMKTSPGKGPVLPHPGAVPPPANEVVKGKRRQEAMGIGERPAAAAGTSQPSSSGSGEVNEFDLLTYNIWFSSDAMSIRMKAIGEIVKSLNYPSFICLQEVTAANLELLRKQPFWHQYTHSPVDHFSTYFTMLLSHKEKLGSPVSYFIKHFPNSVMGRTLLGGSCKLGGTDVCITTVHLESPCNGQKYSQPRKEQLQLSMDTLEDRPEANTLVAGDTNWNTDDGPMVLKPGWKDAWLEKRPGENGYTYNCRENAMLMGSWPPQRFDRVLYKMPSWEPASIEIVGNTPVPNATYQKQLRNGTARRMQVLPSDHYGVLAKFVRKGVRVV